MDFCCLIRLICQNRAERSSARNHLRSDRCVVGILQPKTLPPSFAPDSLQRSRVWEDAHLSDQSVWSSTNDHLRTVQSPMAGRIIFQMDQATSPHQEVLRHIGERRKSANLDRRVGICARGHHKETSRPGCLALHFVTGIFGHPVRENPFKRRLFRHQTYPGR